MWYKNINEESKKKFKSLIKSGQIDIVQGSWVSTDEAVANYEDMILNMQIGHQFLYEEFGIRPRIGWMLDEFGHSAANAALNSDFGFEAIIMSRQSGDTKEVNAAKGELSFIWKPFSRHFGDNKEILAFFTWTHYDGPMQVLHNDIERAEGGDEQWQNDTSLFGYNAMHKCNSLVNHVQEISRYYPHKRNLLVMMGDDFGYMDAFDSFKQVENLMDLCNIHNERNMTFVYSTPHYFVDALKKENITWPVQYGDFLPYFDKKYEYWTGFFSSRPGLKKQIKSYSKLYHAQSRIFARRMINLNSTDEDIQNALKVNYKALDKLAVAQHHDGITGTSTQYVASFYAHGLSESFSESKDELYRDLAKKVKQIANIDMKDHSLKQCHDFMQNDTVAQCPLGQDKNSKEFLVVVLNQNTVQRDHLLRILLPSANFKALIWDRQTLRFKETESDIFEQRHFEKTGQSFEDSIMYLKARVDIDSVAIIKLIKLDATNKT